MNDADVNVTAPPVSVADVGEYCRQVEDYLTRVNGGHLVRIVGPGFEVVRQWAAEQIPLRIVFRGIDRKVERHRSGLARRPLRIEFCEADVRDVLEDWRRAVGLTAGSVAAAADVAAGDDSSSATGERRRPSLTKHLDRVLDRLSRTAGRLELPELLRDGLGGLIADLALMRDAAKPARGPEREERAARLSEMDRELVKLVRATCVPDLIAAARVDAERDLSVYRGRLSGEAWTKAVDATVDQLLRDRLGLPTVEL